MVKIVNIRQKHKAAWSSGRRAWLAIERWQVLAPAGPILTCLCFLVQGTKINLARH